MLSLTDFEECSLPAVAALSGDEETFEVVSTAIRERLQPEQVWYQLFSIRYHSPGNVTLSLRDGRLNKVLLKWTSGHPLCGGMTPIKIVADIATPGKQGKKTLILRRPDSVEPECSADGTQCIGYCQTFS